VSAKVWSYTYWIWMTLLAAAFYARPTWHIVVWSLIGLSSAGAVVTGVVRNRPRRVAPWLLLALGLVSFAAGDTAYNLLTTYGHEDNPFPSIADLFYLVTCVSQVAGIFGLVRAGTANRDRSTLIDSLVLTAGVGVVYWILIIGPNVHRAEFSTLQKAISIAYPLADILVLAMVARLVVVAPRTPAVILLAIGTAGLLTADILYGLSQLHASWAIGGPIDLGWVILYTTWGAAALHPSMVTLTQPRTTAPLQMGRSRLVLLGISSLIAPAALMFEATGGVHDAPVIALLSAVVFLLVIMRLSDVLENNGLVLERERALRQAGDTMVSATDVGDVRAALDTAAARMMRGERGYAIDLLSRYAWGPAGTSGATIRYTATLGRDLPESLKAFELALVCPLPAHEPETTREHINRATMPVAVALGGDEDELSGMKGPLEVLTGQATLALGRIALTEEVNRRKSEEYFRTLVQNTADVILIVDEARTVSYASPSAVSVFGERPVVGENLDDLLAVDHSVQANGLFGMARASQLTERRPTTGGDWIARRQDDVIVHVEASTQDLTADATVKGIVITLRDVTERRRLERELTHHAFHDPLTGVANRLLFQERVRTAVAGANRHGGTVGVLFIDLDDFKIVNDTMGHHAGDQLLVAVVKRLSEVLRPQDTAARLGGDEFAALIEEAADPAEVEEIATQMIAALGEPFFVGDALVSGVSSIGVATTAEANDAQELLRQADLALYVAKGGGKGQWRSYQPALHTAVLKRMQIRTELDQAVKDGTFELYYQPIVELDHMKPVGMEALIRWNHPTTGLVQPADFIEVAEESGLIIALGDWVMRTAIEAASAWTSRPLYVGVNVSARQFRAPGFVDNVRAHLAAAGFPAHRLMLEITESLLLPDEQQVWDDLFELREMGVRIAIDDFGTGYSSLSYLRRVPIDVVKVDKSFVETIGSSEQQRSLVQGIVWLAATLGLEVIAEGIETESDRDLLVGLGCPMGQGYLISPPMSHDASVRWQNADQMAA
jgi:diguanylate cyclase (GGDEF)-like protein/PAS domain S-box-containing protein